MDSRQDSRVTVGFKANADLVAKIDAAANREGISRSDFTRRAAMRDLERQQQGQAA